jgi:zinc transport system substrate-binding protein
MIERFRGIPLAALVLICAALPASAQQQPLRVVATNSWTAAFAAAAGAVDVVTLAPSDLRHPAEYELKPSDVATLQGAGLIVSTGFEVMAKKLADAAGSRKLLMLQIGADYSLATIRTSLLAIAGVTGTEAKARESIASLESFIASWKDELAAAGLKGAPVVAHVFQLPLMKELGFGVRGAFGPGPLEAAQIGKLTPTNARFIVDNWHNEAGGPLRETMTSALYVSLINFPGPDGTKSLLDVLADDRARLKAAAGY